MENRKEKLIDKAIQTPFKFDWKDVEALCAMSDFTFKDVREMIKRIYDINEDILLETSDATTGTIGKKNKKSTDKRINEYNKRIEKGVKYKPNGKIIVAEGDSWFQFPVALRDIIDWLNKRDNYAIYSIAYGGDWITNIIYEASYIGELAIHSPDAFLISGGGNDLVGGNRLAIMVTPDKRNDDDVNRDDANIEALDDISNEIKENIKVSQPYIKDEFYAFVNTLKVMYHKMFKQIMEKRKNSEDEEREYKNMLILTQGYDYPHPRWSKFRILKPYQSILNWKLESGKWLKRPMSIKGILPKYQRPVISTMMLEINEMFKEIATHNENVFHIDCRGVAPKEDDWMDELHLRAKKYEKIANVYSEMIELGLDGCTKKWPNKVAKVVKK